MCCSIISLVLENREMENWAVHPDCPQHVAEWLLRLLPFIKQIDNAYHETIFVDLTRVNLLFDDKMEPLKERWDSENPFWSLENPLPINSIGDDQELLALWPAKGMISDDAQIIFQQSLDDAKFILNVRSEHTKRNIVVACQDTVALEVPVADDSPKIIKVPTLTLYMIQIVSMPTKKITHYVLTTEPNSQINWYCRNCCKRNSSNLRCPECVQEITADDAYSKPGTFYCNAKCQLEDWPRHKQTCRKSAPDM